MASGARPFAGGTDVLIEARETLDPMHLVWTGGVADLRVLSVSDQVEIGAAVTLETLIRSAEARATVSAITDGAGVVGSVQIRNAATVIGNLATASPAADTLPGLYVHDAVVTIATLGHQGRVVPIREFITGPSVTTLEADELVTTVICSTNAPSQGSSFVRFTERAALDLAFVSAAARLTLDDDGAITEVRLALGAVGPLIIDADEAATGLLGKPLPSDTRAVGEAAAELASPIDDQRATAPYRRRIIAAAVADSLARAAGRVR